LPLTERRQTVALTCP